MKKPTGARLRPGDVLETDCAGGVSLLAYVGRHAHFGDLVWVIPLVFPARPEEVCRIASGDGYFQFYAATAAIRHGLVRKIAFCETSMRMIPQWWSHIVQRDEDGFVSVWNVSDGTQRLIRHELSTTERQLPIASVINHVGLCEQIADGWTPERYHRPA